MPSKPVLIACESAPGRIIPSDLCDRASSAELVCVVYEAMVPISGKNPLESLFDFAIKSTIKYVVEDIHTRVRLEHDKKLVMGHSSRLGTTQLHCIPMSARLSCLDTIESMDRQ
jgi:hypothetical protein